MAGFEAILEFIQVLSLAVIIVGTIILGALVAPTLFKQLSKIEAGMAMTELFERFSQWLEISALSLFLARAIDFVFVRNMSFATDSIYYKQTFLKANFDTSYLLSLILIISILIISLYISLDLTPKLMNAYQDDDKEFETLHKKSEKLYRINALIALLALII
jgi:uncharacterized membrane protein